MNFLHVKQNQYFSTRFMCSTVKDSTSKSVVTTISTTDTVTTITTVETTIKTTVKTVDASVPSEETQLHANVPATMEKSHGSISITKEQFLQDFTNKIHPFVLTGNSYIEVSSGKPYEKLRKLSFQELEILIKSRFPFMSFYEVRLFRNQIVDILKMRGFKKTQFRIDNIVNVRLLWTKFFKSTLGGKDNRVRGLQDLCLKSEIIEELFKST
jgi:hypothetical protein